MSAVQDVSDAFIFYLAETAEINVLWMHAFRLLGSFMRDTGSVVSSLSPSIPSDQAKCTRITNDPLFLQGHNLV